MRVPASGLPGNRLRSCPKPCPPENPGIPLYPIRFLTSSAFRVSKIHDRDPGIFGPIKKIKKSEKNVLKAHKYIDKGMILC